MRAFSRDALPGRVVFGAGGARRSLAGEVATLGVRRVLLVATKRGEPLARELTASLQVAAAFTDVREHVPGEVADAALAAAVESDVDGLLAVGGGSSIGTAKAVALRRPLPIVAVPTTYAGSEMTPVWGRTDDGQKRTGRDARVLPRLVVYDPDLVASLPPAVAAASGMNALAHAVRAHEADPVTAVLGAAALRALTDGLPEAVAGRDTAGALYGAYLAASAFAVAGSGRHHTICHVLGGAFGLPHAATHAVLLPYTAAAVPGVDASALRRLAERIGAPTSLEAIGMRAADLDDAVRLVAERTGADERRLLSDALDGRWAR